MSARAPWTREQILAHGQYPDCVFCAIVKGEAPATVLAWWPEVLVIEPLGPVTPGHVLVIPRLHVSDFTDRPDVAAITMLRASAYAAEHLDDQPCNLITSKGREATQSVFHLHLHIVPRAKDDGLALPWYSGKGGH